MKGLTWHRLDQFEATSLPPTSTSDAEFEEELKRVRVSDLPIEDKLLREHCQNSKHSKKYISSIHF
jgi:hypothetical protein